MKKGQKKKIQRKEDKLRIIKKYLKNISREETSKGYKMQITDQYITNGWHKRQTQLLWTRQNTAYKVIAIRTQKA